MSREEDDSNMGDYLLSPTAIALRKHLRTLGGDGLQEAAREAAADACTIASIGNISTPTLHRVAVMIEALAERLKNCEEEMTAVREALMAQPEQGDNHD